MTYRLARESDLDEICLLIKSAIAEMESHGIPQWDEIYPAREDFLSDIKSNSLYAGEVFENGKNRIAVIYVVNKESDEEYKKADWQCSGDYRVIHRLCVHPDFQNRGIAKETLCYIEKKLAPLGIQSIRLDVFSQNPFSLRLYEHAGYHKTGEANWRKGLFYLMEKKIVQEKGRKMQITEITNDKKDFLPLLLLADEQESMIDLYLERGKMFVLDDGGVKAECVITDEGDGVLEIKNIATDPDSQGKGYGRALLEFVEENFRGEFKTLQVGTGDSPLTIPFYEKCGFTRHHVIKDFFTKNYNHPIIECGVQLVDMIVLRKNFDALK